MVRLHHSPGWPLCGRGRYSRGWHDPGCGHHSRSGHDPGRGGKPRGGRPFGCGPDLRGGENLRRRCDPGRGGNRRGRCHRGRRCYRWRGCGLGFPGRRFPGRVPGHHGHQGGCDRDSADGEREATASVRVLDRQRTQPSGGEQSGEKPHLGPHFSTIKGLDRHPCSPDLTDLLPHSPVDPPGGCSRRPAAAAGGRRTHSRARQASPLPARPAVHLAEAVGQRSDELAGPGLEAEGF